MCPHFRRWNMFTQCHAFRIRSHFLGGRVYFCLCPLGKIIQGSLDYTSFSFSFVLSVPCVGCLLWEDLVIFLKHSCLLCYIVKAWWLDRFRPHLAVYGNLRQWALFLLYYYLYMYIFVGGPYQTPGSASSDQTCCDLGDEGKICALYYYLNRNYFKNNLKT